jgi:glyoxylase-like metal-dependent hydrolase (beta-lactamase superfamily II)
MTADNVMHGVYPVQSIRTIGGRGILAANRGTPYIPGVGKADPSVNETIVRGIVVGAFQENCWVIGNRRTGEAICVDPGDEPDEILAMAKDMGVAIKYIANSHAHIDHILGVGAVREATGAKFLLHPGDLELARNTANAARSWLRLQIPNPPDPDAFLADGDAIDVDGLKLRVIHTPGHTPGSVSFYANGVLFAGDTLFAGSIGRTDLPGGDYDEEMASIVGRLLVLPDDTIVLPGHMDQTTIGHERQRNPYVRMELAKRAGN